MRADRKGYLPFPDVGWRNALQRYLELPLLVWWLRPPSGQRILEVGCGRGVGLQALAGLCRPALLVGIDVDKRLVLAAEHSLRERGVRALVSQADVRSLPFDDESFDTVFDFGTCHHISEPVRALGEIARVLRPGGTFVCESGLAQLLSHPGRGSRRALPWSLTPSLVPDRAAFLWSARKKGADRV